MISQNALHHAEKCRFCWMCRHLCPVQHQTGKELTRAHRYLQQQMFKVFICFMRQLAYNYKQGACDERNAWASQLASEAYTHLIESEIIYDPNFKK